MLTPDVCAHQQREGFPCSLSTSNPSLIQCIPEDIFYFIYFFQFSLYIFSGMHWMKLGLEALKHARKPFPLLMRTGAWGQHPLALGPSRDIPSSFARDGDSIPFSMTCLSGFLRGLSQFPRPEMVILLNTVVLEMCLVALIILVPVRAPNSTNVSSREAFKFRI